jgi:hypothetical protein
MPPPSHRPPTRPRCLFASGSTRVSRVGDGVPPSHGLNAPFRPADAATILSFRISRRCESGVAGRALRCAPSATALQSDAPPERRNFTSAAVSSPRVPFPPNATLPPHVALAKNYQRRRRGPRGGGFSRRKPASAGAARRLKSPERTRSLVIKNATPPSHPNAPLRTRRLTECAARARHERRHRFPPNAPFFPHIALAKNYQ